MGSFTSEAAAHVPIIGQAYSVAGCTLIPLVTCSCGHTFTVMAQFVGAQLASVPAVCACGKTYALAAVQPGTDGQLRFGFQVRPPASES